MIARAGIVRADRRSVLLGAGAAAAGVVASFSSSPAAAQGRVDQECMTIVYQSRGQPGADAAPPPYVATISIWIADDKAFDEARTQHQAGLRADVPKFTNAVLIAQARSHRRHRYVVGRGRG